MPLIAQLQTILFGGTIDDPQYNSWFGSHHVDRNSNNYE